MAQGPTTSDIERSLSAPELIASARTREGVISLLNHAREAYKEWVRRVVIRKRRLDILCALVLGYDVHPKIHYPIIRHQFAHQTSMVLAARSFGKSTIGTISKCIHYILCDPNIRIVLASKVADNAEGFLAEIKGHFENNEELKDIFGEFVGDKEWGKGSMQVRQRTNWRKEPTILTVGVGSAVASKHTDVGFGDDLIDEENSRTEHQRNNIKTWYYKVFKPVIDPPDPTVPYRGSVHILGTRYHYDDLYGHFLSHEFKDDKTLTIPALDENDESTYPEKFPTKFLHELRENAGSLVFNCHSEDTEFLTKRGWKCFDRVKPDDELATMNKTTGLLEFQIATSRSKQRYNGKLLHLRNRGIDALVTPNHRIWLATLHGPRKGLLTDYWHFAEACDLSDVGYGAVELPVVPLWIGKKRRWIRIDDLPRKTKRKLRGSASAGNLKLRLNDFLRFLGYFISEGSTANKSRGVISFSQREGDTANDIVDSVRSLGFEPNINTKHKPYVHIVFSHIGLWSWLRKYCGVGSANKRIPRVVFKLPPKQIWKLLVPLINGDGHWNGERGSSGSFFYSTTSKRLNNDLHELCLRVGVVLSSRLRTYNNEKWAPCFQSYGHKAHTTTFRAKKSLSSVDYKGNVVCFSVPNRTLITRRNGRVLVSGNTQYKLDAEAMRGEIFDIDDCDTMSQFPHKDSLVFGMGVDLAIGKKSSSDFFAIVVAGMDEREHLWIWDFIEKRFSFNTQQKTIEEWYQRWERWLKACRIDSESYQAVASEELLRKHRDWRIIPWKSRVDKETRAQKLSPMFEQGRVHFRPDQQRLIEVLVTFPHGHDDLFDALDLAIAAIKLKKRKKVRDEEPGLF